ncbi:hypothetical protein Ddye_019782 [Dipteronia dyeriana]|uniref:Reverse transcriptase domain-containing protein n=1 Tax=Dipteronia dyeriana TaxID=168575 RepID=A0AAD9TYR1_9ROSI|nr:hypothetical protein Ddye_019782 [Dipteronia dyeriana]
MATGLSFNKLSVMDSAWLEERFNLEEVKEALANCDGNTALGPDGFNLGFVKANWDVIERDFMKFIEEFNRYGAVVKDLNKTFITLIPRCDKLEFMAEEIIHHWRSSKEGGLLVKLDFEKAYDTVDHSFLEELLKQMGFGS